ncbi:TetR family transcriptional regulator [Amycolatopsis rhizosphaerae]|uniref:TetR family transcriptional regulator n=1 Tax=Amycolatopsis rhizosphaerae TaxID=2053003 RepID=A0A558C0J9_9PSEU|nr:TetR/AcrR family transcriptional regulator C-terminal ligand-binding domain-containing protein [Amycolatopsis rhizosphaerae]TVT42290.1 TetR family transcriptional regulator [Amycolatopsis rhizosphaerae]
METTSTERTAGRRRDPQTDAAAIEAVLDLVSAGATLSGLSLVTIAEHVGVSRNTLYRRWKTKEELYLDVLNAVNRPLPEFGSPTPREDLAAYLAILIERTLDRRAGSVLRALQAEAQAFPELHRRYFDEIIAPRRETVYRILRRGIAAGEIRPGIDIEFVGELLVAPILARMASGAIEKLDPETTGHRIVEHVYRGIQA